MTAYVLTSSLFLLIIIVRKGRDGGTESPLIHSAHGHIKSHGKTFCVAFCKSVEEEEQEEEEEEEE